jgi:hypothetical protein
MKHSLPNSSTPSFDEVPLLLCHVTPQKSYRSQGGTIRGSRLYGGEPLRYGPPMRSPLSAWDGRPQGLSFSIEPAGLFKNTP